MYAHHHLGRTLQHERLRRASARRREPTTSAPLADRSPTIRWGAPIVWLGRQAKTAYVATVAAMRG